MDAPAKLARIAAAMKAAGEIELRLALTRTIRAQAEPLKSAVQRSALERLPHGGGLAAREAAGVKVSVLTSARSAGVRVVNPRRGASQAESGYVRHPVFGTKKWVTQQIPGAAGWWSEPLQKEGPAVEVEITATINAVAARVLL